MVFAAREPVLSALNRKSLSSIRKTHFPPLRRPGSGIQTFRTVSTGPAISPFRYYLGPVAFFPLVTGDALSFVLLDVLFPWDQRGL